jgi:diacylglycerol kinase (ATP)
VKNKPIVYRLGHALAGIAHAARSENSFRFQLAAAAVVFAILLYLRPAPLWWALVMLTTLSVLAAELFNTAIEILADHLHPEQHPNIKRVKDCAAGAVLLSSAAAVTVALALVFSYLQ